MIRVVCTWLAPQSATSSPISPGSTPRIVWTRTADPTRYEFHIAYVTPDQQWRFPVDLSSRRDRFALPMSVADAVQYMSVLQPDVVLPQMFCLPGMTSYRALFDVLDIPVVGNTPDVMALGRQQGQGEGRRGGSRGAGSARRGAATRGAAVDCAARSWSNRWTGQLGRGDPGP